MSPSYPNLKLLYCRTPIRWLKKTFICFIQLKLNVVHVKVYFIIITIITTQFHCQSICLHVSTDTTLKRYCTRALASQRELRKSWWFFKWINHCIKNEQKVIFSSFHYNVAYSDQPIYPFDGGMMASECGISACLHNVFVRFFTFNDCTN